MDGREVISKFILLGPNKLVENQSSVDGDLKTILTRIFYPEGMEVIMEVNEVTAQSYFKRKELQS